MNLPPSTKRAMKQFCASLIWSSLLLCFASGAAPPHVLMIVVDDVGYADVSYNNGLIPTPEIDKLSSDGIRLGRYYTPTVCTPARMALLTGKYSHASGLGSGTVLIGPAPYSLPEGTDTLAKAFNERGYKTHAVGKWHLGSTRIKDMPTGRSWGFESFTGLLHGAGGHYSKSISGPVNTFYDYHRSFSNGTYTPDHDDRHSTKCLTDEAKDVIKRHAEHDSAKPLFLYLAYTAGHTPLLSDPEWLEKCQHLAHPLRRDYCGLVVGADEGIRNVTEYAKAMLGDNIIVGFATDNGGMLHVGGLNTPLRGSKNTGYEGGVRGIAFITDMTATKRYLPARSDVQHQGLIHVADWMPTLLGIADGAKAGLTRKEACTQSTTSPPTLAHGFNQWCSLASNSSSPRTDAVLVLDDNQNFVSYLQPPYKILIGHHGEGGWGAEPTGQFLYPNATFLQKAEEWMAVVLDYLNGSRDVSFFYHEVLHVMIARMTRPKNLYDFANVNKFVLGSSAGGDVMNSTVLTRDEIPVAVFNVWEDPEERVDISMSNPDVTASMLASFNSRHWKDHPRQFNMRDVCYNIPRKESPGLCSKRTSHLFKNMNQKSVSASIPCVFDGPFIDDDDVRPCGPYELINALDMLAGFIRQQAIQVLVAVLAVTIAVLALASYGVVKFCKYIGVGQVVRVKSSASKGKLE